MPVSWSSPFRWSDRRALDVLLLDMDTVGAQALEVRDGVVRAIRNGLPLPLALPAAPSNEDLCALVIQWVQDDGRLDSRVAHDLLQGRSPMTLGRTLVLDRFRRLRFRLDLWPACVGDGWTVSLRWMPLLPQPLRDLGLSPLLGQRLSTLPRQGLVVLGGASGVGSTTLLNATVQHWAQTNGGDSDGRARRRGTLVSRRHEQWFATEHRGATTAAATVLQSSPLNPEEAEGMTNALRSALRSNQDLIALDEVRAREEMDGLIACAESGHLTLGTLYADDGLVTLFRRMRGLQAPSVQRLSTLHAVRLLAWQGWFDTPDGSRVRLHEHLVLNDAVRAEIAAASPVRLNTVLHDAMVEQGSDRVSDARARWALDLLNDATLEAVLAGANVRV